MKLFFQYPRPIIKNPIVKKITTVQVLHPTVLSGSMFERIQNPESCHSCRGVK